MSSRKRPSRSGTTAARWTDLERDQLWNSRNQHLEKSWPEFHKLNLFPDRTRDAIYHEFMRLQKENLHKRMNTIKEKRTGSPKNKAKRSSQFQDTAEERARKLARKERECITVSDEETNDDDGDINIDGKATFFISPRKPRDNGSRPPRDNTSTAAVVQATPTPSERTTPEIALPDSARRSNSYQTTSPVPGHDSTQTQAGVSPPAGVSQPSLEIDTIAHENIKDDQVSLAKDKSGVNNLNARSSSVSDQERSASPPVTREKSHPSDPASSDRAAHQSKSEGVVTQDIGSGQEQRADLAPPAQENLAASKSRLDPVQARKAVLYITSYYSCTEQENRDLKALTDRQYGEIIQLQDMVKELTKELKELKAHKEDTERKIKEFITSVEENPSGAPTAVFMENPQEKQPAKPTTPSN